MNDNTDTSSVTEVSTPKGYHIWTSTTVNERNRYEKGIKESVNKIGVLLTGVTGSGKTTICNVVLDEEIKVNHSVESSSSILDIHQNDKYVFLDTKGTQNSDSDQSTDVITKEILKQCYLNGITEIKVIWCIDSDTTKMKSEFQNIVKFLLSINQNVFNNTCMIIKKKGNDNNINGIVAAVKKHSENEFDEKTFCQNYFNVNCIDSKLNSNENDIFVYGLVTNYFNDKRDEINKKGYYTTQEYKHLITQTLQQLDSVSIGFNINKCVNCSEIGDPRFVSSNCHYIKAYKHSTTIVKNFHAGKKVFKQALSYKHIHGRREMRHSGTYSKEHIGTISITDMKTPLHNDYHGLCYDSNVERQLRYIDILSHFQTSKPEIEEIMNWTCCKQRNEFAEGCYEYCVDCGKLASATTGCIQQQSGEFECFCTNCDRHFDSYGCCTQYICSDCGKETKNQGCKSVCCHCKGQWNTSKCHQDINLH